MKVLILPSFALFVSFIQVHAQAVDPRIGNGNPVNRASVAFSSIERLGDAWYDIDGVGVSEISNFPWIYGRQFGWAYVYSSNAGSGSRDNWLWIESMDNWYLFPGADHDYVWSDSHEAWLYFHIDTYGYGWVYDFSEVDWERVRQFRRVPSPPGSGSPAPVELPLPDFSGGVGSAPAEQISEAPGIPAAPPVPEPILPPPPPISEPLD